MVLRWVAPEHFDGFVQRVLAAVAGTLKRLARAKARGWGSRYTKASFMTRFHFTLGLLIVSSLWFFVLLLPWPGQRLQKHQ